MAAMANSTLRFEAGRLVHLVIVMTAFLLYIVMKPVNERKKTARPIQRSGGDLSFSDEARLARPPVRFFRAFFGRVVKLCRIVGHSSPSKTVAHPTGQRGGCQGPILLRLTDQTNLKAYQFAVYGLVIYGPTNSIPVRMIMLAVDMVIHGVIMWPIGRSML